MEFSAWNQRYNQESGILELMDDLGKAMSEGLQTGGIKAMLGGGNPASITGVNALWRQSMEGIMERQDAFEDMLVNYDSPQGKTRFLDSLAGMLNTSWGWPVDARNIAVCNGSQAAFFYLFNLLAGRKADGRIRRILFPLVPEYIGYADQSLHAQDLKGLPARIQLEGERRFKYHIDNPVLQDCLGQAVRGQAGFGALCVSRPSNPTGNVLDDSELSSLVRVCEDRDIPLLVDNAYGQPFPGIIHREVRPVWNQHVVWSMSLSKLGLPATRTGIIVARQEIIQAISAMNAITSLASGSLGQTLVEPLLRDGRILRVCQDLIRPWYRERRDRMLGVLDRELEAQGVPYRIHQCEGAFFAWMWLPWMEGRAREAYGRLKAEGVLVVPGEPFFFGLEGPHRFWGIRHGSSCLRISYGRPDNEQDYGARVLARVLGQLYRETPAEKREAGK